MTPDPAAPFTYLGYDVDEARAGDGGGPNGWTLRCRYGLGQWTFEERITVGEDGDGRWSAGADEAARLVYLLAGVSYYKAAAPPVVDLGETPVRAGEVEFLRTFFVEGLGEYAYRNGLDLSGLVVAGGRPVTGGPPAPGPAGAGIRRPLVPFGGGLDSIVTVEWLRDRVDDVTLFVMSRPGDRFAAIEDAAALTGLPVRRAGRQLDAKILRSADFGFRNGHVPVTGVVSAIAVLVAALHDRDAVVMSNERSASAGNLRHQGREINHQWSKGMAFERAFASAVTAAVGGRIAYYSQLRACTELWIAQRFATLERYHGVFRSCNRAFALDPARRLDHWCGTCDKCCFVDLVLAPFLTPGRLAAVFGGREPLEDAGLQEQFRALLGLSDDQKPWECVGDLDECRAALVLAAGRPDRSDNPLLEALLAELGPAAADAARASIPDLLVPEGPDSVPSSLAVAGGAVRRR